MKKEFEVLIEKFRAKEEDGVYNFGKISIKDWRKIYKTWRSMFEGGSWFCIHEWGVSDDLPPRGIKAVVVYPNGVRTVKSKVYDWVEKCGKCGKVKGEEISGII